MNKNIKVIATLTLASLFLFVGCSNDNETKPGTKTYTVGAMQIMEHPSLDGAYAGFKQALADKGLQVKYNLQNAQGDMNNNIIIAKNFVSDHVDLIFANSTPSAQSALSATKTIPIIFTSLSDPVSAKLVPSMTDTSGNITGTLDVHPQSIPNTIKFIANEFHAKRIGMIYNAGEQNSVAQVDIARKEADKLGLSVVTATASNTSEVKQAAESLVGRADVFYVISDNTAVTAIKSVINVAVDKKIPLFTGEQDSVRLGAFASFGFDYYDIGYEAGVMAYDILTGQKKVSELPVQYPKTLKLLINKAAAQKMGIALKPEWNSIAQYI